MTTRLGLGRRADDGYVLRQTASIGLGPVRLLRGAPHLRCGAACLCRWPARGRWEEGVPAAGGAVSRVAGVRVHSHGRGLRRGRVHSARPGTCRRGRGPSTPSGTGIRSPYARAVPGWSGPHPAARNVPACGGGTVASGCSGGVRSAPVQPAPSVELPAVRLDDMGRERPPSPSKIHK